MGDKFQDILWEEEDMVSVAVLNTILHAGLFSSIYLLNKFIGLVRCSVEKKKF